MSDDLRQSRVDKPGFASRKTLRNLVCLRGFAGDKVSANFMQTHLTHLSRKKTHLDHHRPLSPALAKNLDDWFRVELTEPPDP